MIRRDRALIRMIATDLDGTLLAGKSNLPEENIKALQRAMEKGVRVVLSSGRIIEAMTFLSEKIKVNAPLICYNGAMVYDPGSDEILYGKTIPCETAVKVLREIEKTGVHVQACPGRSYYFPEYNNWTAYYEDKVGPKGQPVHMPLSEWLTQDVYKFLCLGENHLIEKLARDLAPMFPDVSFIKSAEWHLEVVAKGVDKFDGLKFLGESMGIAQEEIMAFGDEHNDLGMLDYAGQGYLMDNAPANINRSNYKIAPKNTDCGVARIVNLYLNEGRMGG